MEEKQYKLGNYEFETFREYRQAQDDLKKIKYITDQLDIHDPEVALRLYNLMRTKKIKLNSEIGKSFFWCISDIVAENSSNIIQKKQDEEEIENLHPHVETNWRKIIGIAFIAIALICFGYYGIHELRDYQSVKKLENLQKMTDINNMGVYAETEVDMTETQTEIQNKNKDQETEKLPPAILDEYVSMHDQNPEMVGWIKIDGTPIDYPVMQSGQDNYDFYLTHAFDKSDDLNGTLFVDARNNLLNRDTNVIIYGHNMKSGMMFGSLKSYLDETYLNQHPTITFNTIYEKANYQIIAVCLAKVEYQDEQVFRYYDFLNAKDEKSFSQYLGNIQQLSVFKRAIDVNYKDKLLTLSTCNNYIEDGRLFLVAKKI